LHGRAAEAQRYALALKGSEGEILQTILLAFVIAWNTLPASSPLCFCEVPEVAQAFEQAKAVFVGEVMEIVAPGTSDENSALPNQLYVVRFKVEKSWKGVPFGSEIDVLSDLGRGCFFHPKVEAGKRYLVYADPDFDNGGESRGLMIITNCNRTARVTVSAAIQTVAPPVGAKSPRWFWRSRKARCDRWHAFKAPRITKPCS
jgi:hypothetical protein